MSDIKPNNLFWPLLTFPLTCLGIATIAGSTLAYVIDDTILRIVLPALARTTLIFVGAVIFWRRWRNLAGTTNHEIAGKPLVAGASSATVRPTIIGFLVFAGLHDSSWLRLLDLNSAAAGINADFLLAAACFIVAYEVYRRLLVLDAREAAARIEAARGSQS